MNENTLVRIKKYIDFKGISIRAFELKFGFSNGSFASQLKNGKTIGVDRIENILNKYSDINAEWLLTGKGEMLRSEIEISSNNQEKSPGLDYLFKKIDEKDRKIEELLREIGDLRVELGNLRGVRVEDDVECADAGRLRAG